MVRIMNKNNRFWTELGFYHAVSIMLYITIAIIFVGGLKYYSITSTTLNEQDMIVLGVVSWLTSMIVSILAYLAFRRGVLKNRPSKLD